MDENENESRESEQAVQTEQQASAPSSAETAFLTQLASKISEMFDLQKNTNARLEAFFTNSAKKESEVSEVEEDDDDSLKY